MAKENKKPVEIKVQFKAIEVINFSLAHPSKDKLNSTLYHFNLNIKHNFNNEQKLVYVLTKVDVFHEDKETQLGSIGTSCIFRIDNFNEFILSEKDKKPSFPDEIIHMFNSISISTTRGVMFSYFRGTFLHNAVLPIFDPKALKPDSE